MITKFNPFIFLLSTCMFNVNFSLASAFKMPTQYFISNILTFTNGIKITFINDMF